MNEQTCLFVTHQARLKCLFNEFMNPNRIQDLIPYRFMNGCVLRLTLMYDTMELSLVDNGEIDESKPGYIFYVKPDVNEPDVNYTQPRQPPKESSYRIITFRDISVDTPSSIQEYMNPTLKIVYYLIRHGQGTHNVTSGTTKKYNQVFGEADAELTNIGIQQASDVGDKLAVLLKDSNTVDHIFVSDLIRTQQTAATIYKQLSSKEVNVTKRLVVIPCSHELTYSRQGCDGNQWSVPRENMTKCIQIKDCQKIVYDIPVDWSVYNAFYNGTRRSRTSDNKCRTTNMIVSSVAYSVGQTTPKFIQNTPSNDLGDTTQQALIQTNPGIYPSNVLGDTTQQALIQNNPGIYLGGYTKRKKRNTKRKKRNTKRKKRNTRQRT